MPAPSPAIAPAVVRTAARSAGAQPISGVPPSLPERYRPIERVGVGGIGEVWRVVDENLNRDLAVKVLRPDRRTPDHAARLVREALLTGRLQHPGVPPVVERGGDPTCGAPGNASGEVEGSGPFFAMKLVGGKTLREMLHESPRPDAARLLGVFRQVCDAVGFAHAADVIHRDIKPSNVMVGDHGEVQVMDWGMARLTKRDAEAAPGDVAPDDPTVLIAPREPAPGTLDPAEQVTFADLEATVIAPASGTAPADLTVGGAGVTATGVTATDDAGTADAGTDDTVHTPSPATTETATAGDRGGAHSTGPAASDSTFPDPLATMTETGAGLGTPAYMPPEQARGEIDRVDARSDVFGLGAVLCTILTDRSPFHAETAIGSLRLAARADLTAAHARLDACDADEPLKALCRLCLSPDPADRPEDGVAVADAVRAHESSVRERLEQARADRAAAEVRVEEERKRRRVGLAALAALLVAGAAGLLWFDAADRLGVVRQERAAAEVAATTADRARGEEEAARLAAERARTKAEQARTAAEMEQARAEAGSRAARATLKHAEVVENQSIAVAIEAKRYRLMAEQAEQAAKVAAAQAQKESALSIKLAGMLEAQRNDAEQARKQAETLRMKAVEAAEANRRERAAIAADRAAAEVRSLIDRAAARRDAGRFAAAVDLILTGERLVPAEGGQALTRQLARELADTRRTLVVAADLEDARLPRTGDDAWHGGAKGRLAVERFKPMNRFNAIFKAYGLNALDGEPRLIGREIAVSPVAPALLAGLDGWCEPRRRRGTTSPPGNSARLRPPPIPPP